MFLLYSSGTQHLIYPFFFVSSSFLSPFSQSYIVCFHFTVLFPFSFIAITVTIFSYSYGYSYCSSSFFFHLFFYIHNFITLFPSYLSYSRLLTQAYMLFTLFENVLKAGQATKVKAESFYIITVCNSLLHITYTI